MEISDLFLTIMSKNCIILKNTKPSFEQNTFKIFILDNMDISVVLLMMNQKLELN